MSSDQECVLFSESTERDIFDECQRVLDSGGVAFVSTTRAMIVKRESVSKIGMDPSLFPDEGGYSNRVPEEWVEEYYVEPVGSTTRVED